MYISELAGWYVKEMPQSLTVNILGPVREGPSRSQIIPDPDGAGVLCCLLEEPPAFVKGCVLRVASLIQVSGVENLLEGCTHSGQQRQPWAQPSFQLGVTVCVFEKLVYEFFLFSQV